MSYPAIKLAGEQVLADDFNDYTLNPAYTYGETITAGQAVYLKASDGKVYKAAANVRAAVEAFVGIAYVSGIANDVNRILGPGKIVPSLSGLTAGANIYLSDTAGALSTTPGTFSLLLGSAISTTAILLVKHVRQVVTSVYGDGSDGSFAISSGTTTWNTAGKEVYQYTDFAITGTGSLTLGSNLQNKRIFVLVDGDLTITSAAAKALNLDGFGGIGGVGTVNIAGTDGENGMGMNSATPSKGGGGGMTTHTPTVSGSSGGGGGGCASAGGAGVAASGSGGSPGAAGAAGATTFLPFLSTTQAHWTTDMIIQMLACGGGGGGGGGISSSGAFAVPGNGGKGGGCMIFIVRGNVNITGTFSALGIAGVAGSNDNVNYHPRGGGSGAGGAFGIFYAGTLTANTATFNVTGGAATDSGGVGGNGFSVVRQLPAGYASIPIFF